MAKYLTEPVENGTPYSDILDIHNRMIYVGKLIRFYYRFIKDYTTQIANKHSLSIDWQGLPDDIEFNHNKLQEGDVVAYLNDLVNLVNKSKDMMYVALNYYTDFFKFWLDLVDSDKDGLSNFIVSDEDVHRKPVINYAHFDKTWSYGEIINADDFNQLKQHVYELFRAMNKTFGAYYSLIQLEGLDTKSSEFSDYGVNVTEQDLSWDSNNIIQDWTNVEPPTIESGATKFLEYDDAHQINNKVIVWESSDGTAHRFTIWDYFKQEYVFDSGWYPKQDYPEQTIPNDYIYLTKIQEHSVMISSDYKKIRYVTYGIYRLDDRHDAKYHLYNVFSDAIVYDLETGDVTAEDSKFSDGYVCDDDMTYKDIVMCEEVFKSRHYSILSFAIKYDAEDDYEFFVTDTIKISGVSINHKRKSFYDERMGEYNYTKISSDLITEFKSKAVAYSTHVCYDNHDDDYYWYNKVAVYFVDENLEFKEVYSDWKKYDRNGNDPVDMYSRVSAKCSAPVKYLFKEEDGSGYYGFITSQGVVKTYYSGISLGSTGYKLSYGLPITYITDSAHHYILRTNIAPDLINNTESALTGFDKTTDFFCEDCVVMPYQPGYNTNIPRISKISTINSTDKLTVYTNNFFVAKTWETWFELNTPDTFAYNESADLHMFYRGLDEDLESSYSVLKIEVI